MVNTWRRKGLMAWLVLAASVVGPTGARSEGGVPGLDSAAMATIRARGPEGLAAVIAAYEKIDFDVRIAVAQSDLAAAEAQLNPTDTTPQRDAFAAELRTNLDRLVQQQALFRAAIDQIGGQRSCTASRLYWYTDFEKAKAEAQRTGRPILHLRMLGKLTDEFSCANSRFFRTALYSNKEISDFLRNRFVLHWQSVRPVPRVTIDFGDGRKLERTLTGNSAHYALAADGRPLDVLPGLYGPQRFLQWLNDVQRLHDEQYRNADASTRQTVLRDFHQARARGILMQWNTDVGRLGEAKALAVAQRIDGALALARANGEEVPKFSAAEAAPDAVKAARQAFAKAAMEAPMFRLANLGGRWLERGMDEGLWQAIADLHQAQAKLDESSIALMRSEFPTAAQAGPRAGGKFQVEDPVLRMVRQFENSIRLDAVRNEYLLHRQIHELFAAGDEKVSDVNKLNEWVYAELFLTPSSDPWLGLAPNDVYTALESNGQVVSAVRE